MRSTLTRSTDMLKMKQGTELVTALARGDELNDRSHLNVFSRINSWILLTSIEEGVGAKPFCRAWRPEESSFQTP